MGKEQQALNPAAINGAETEEEVNLLREWGVDMVQGYYFSRPLPEAELLRLFML